MAMSHRGKCNKMTNTKTGDNKGHSETESKSFDVLQSWTGRFNFLSAQAQLFGILAIAVIGDRWEPSYQRNGNHNMPIFWAVHVVLLVLAAATWTHKPSSDGGTVTFLSRGQTEEWKGWMQFAFIMYHYYRARSAYNWIRVFVSSYVWMTGFGNFLYFDKKKDFSMKRMVSMWIRINYFPIALSLATGLTMDEYYVVPLHTEGFFMTWITCRLAVYLEERHKFNYWRSRVAAIAFSALAHILFFETPAVDSLLFFSKEIHFRFQADKYSALLGIASGALMKKITEYMTWAYSNGDNSMVSWCQRVVGLLLIVAWFATYGHIDDKYTYNPVHPYIFILPMTGWLMIRNSSKYLSECHCTLLEFLGRNTLETYVLQFHLFMNHGVQHIPVVIPGSGEDGTMPLRFLNMLVCGFIFLTVSVQARKITVTTQTTVTELFGILQGETPTGYAALATEEKKTITDGDVEIGEKK